MLDLLFAGKFDEYIHAFRENSPLWVFVHVPKTAGSSLRGELANVLLPEANIFVDYDDPTKTFQQGLDAAVARFIARNAKEPHRFASGHIFPQHVEAIAKAARTIRRLTMLRNPVRRVISDYRYQCSSMHPGNDVFRSSFPSLASYLEQEGEMNKATRYLVPEEILATGDAEACLAYITRTYDFVGLQEMYPLAFRFLFALVDDRRAPTLRMRVNEGGEELASDPGVIAEVEARNALDVAIHKALLAKWKVIRDPLIEHLTETQAATAPKA